MFTRPLFHFHKKNNLTLNSLIEKLAYVAGIINPLATLPQFFQIWMKKDASGVSLVTWVSFLMISIIMTIYGYLHREKPLMMMYGSLIVVNFMVVLGILVC